MASLKAMYEEYVEQKHFITTIATYNLLQDVIEMMFARIRACCGANNNPNTDQFKGAYRKIQCNMKLNISTSTNCRVFDTQLPDNLFYSNIYFVSSLRAKIVMDESKYNSQKDSILQDLGDETMYDGCDDAEIMNATHHLLDGSAVFMITYLAAKIEQKIMQCKNFHCNDCQLIFEISEKIDTIDVYSSSYTPCHSTVEICKKAEKFFKLYDGHTSKPRYDFKVLYCLIFRSMNFEVLYSNSKFECNKNHKYHFIKCIVGQYITMRASQISRQITLNRQDKIICQHCNHLINFKGQ